MSNPNESEPKTKRTVNHFHLYYGIALVVAGLGVFYRIPQVMPKIESFKQFAAISWFVRSCFYIMGIILFGGGIKKILNHFKESHSENRKER